MIALGLYVRKYKVNLMRVLDNIAIATPICACFIRLGNLMNSEIVGKYTGSDFGFIFVQNGDTLPRHPGQLYEAIAYFVFFIIGILLYRRWKEKVGTGFYFGYCLATIFPPSVPFVEFFKEVQEPWKSPCNRLLGLTKDNCSAFLLWH